MLTGIGLVIIGLILVPVLPHIQLDAVLTSAELADDSKRSETLALLQKASGNGWLITTGLGVFIFVVSFVGYRSVVRISHTPRQFPENKSDLP